VKYFVKRYAESNKLPLPEIPAPLLSTLKSRDWPGNVRELENTIERLIVLADNGHLSEEHLHIDKPRLQSRHPKHPANGPQDVESLVRQLVKLGVQSPLPAGTKLYDFLVGGVEKELINQVMRLCGNVKITAADRLGINRNTLHKKLEEYERTDALEPAQPPTNGV
jgi:Nif-specific regulatory protein